MFALIAVAYSVPFVRAHPRISFCICYVAYFVVLAISVITSNYWMQGIVIPFLLLLFLFVFITAHKQFNRSVIVAALLTGIGALCLTLSAERHAMEYRIDRAVVGKRVKPVTLLGLPILDVTAERAHVTILDKIEEPPVELKDPHLLFLGKSSSMAAFIGCGNTVILPLDKLSIRTSNNGMRNAEEEPKRTALRWKFCQCVHADGDDCARQLAQG